MKKIKYAFQRVFRGWNDRDTWSYDNVLVNTLPALKQCIADMEASNELDNKQRRLIEKTRQHIQTIEDRYVFEYGDFSKEYLNAWAYIIKHQQSYWT